MHSAKAGWEEIKVRMLWHCQSRIFVMGTSLMVISGVQHSLEEGRCHTVHVMVKRYLLCFCMGSPSAHGTSQPEVFCLVPWIGSRSSGCILPCPVPLVDPAGSCFCPFLRQPAGLGYVLSDTPTAFTAERKHFRTESTIMDLRNPGFWTIPGFPTCGPSLSLSPEEMQLTTHYFKVVL